MGKIVQAIALVLVKCESGQIIFDSSLLSPAFFILPTVKETLVICPVVTVIQWVNEIDRFTTKGSSKVLVYHSANWKKNMDKFIEYDFVITTYSTVDTEYRKYIMILHFITWNHIIFDEAHHVKDIRSNTIRAILALEFSYKWDLSGTPLQNSVGELHSLVRFLQILPYSYRFSTHCDCRALEYRYIQDGMLMDNYADILYLLTRLRQILLLKVRLVTDKFILVDSIVELSLRIVCGGYYFSSI